VPEQDPSSYESFKETVDPELSSALDEAAHYVTNNIDLVVNGEVVEHPYEGTYTTAAVVAGAKTTEEHAPEILTAAAAKQKSQHLEDTMGYGDLSPIAFKKAEQLVSIAEKVPAEKLHTSNPQTTGALLDSGTSHAFMGAARVDHNPGSEQHKFVIGTSGGEGTRELIRAMFPDETFDFNGDPTQLERGAGLLDELVSRMVGGVMVLKAMGVNFGDERIKLELNELQKDNIAKTKRDVRNVPGNLNDDGSQKISID